MTSAEKLHLSKVAALGCFLCRRLGYGYVGSQIHHLREGVGLAQRNSNWLVVPLCAEHHTGSVDGIHGQRRAWKLASVGEMDALADTLALVYG